MLTVSGIATGAQHEGIHAETSSSWGTGHGCSRQTRPTSPVHYGARGTGRRSLSDAPTPEPSLLPSLRHGFTMATIATIVAIGTMDPRRVVLILHIQIAAT